MYSVVMMRTMGIHTHTSTMNLTQIEEQVTKDGMTNVDKLNTVHCQLQELIHDIPNEEKFSILETDLYLMLSLVEEVRNNLMILHPMDEHGF